MRWTRSEEGLMLETSNFEFLINSVYKSKFDLCPSRLVSIHGNNIGQQYSSVALCATMAQKRYVTSNILPENGGEMNMWFILVCAILVSFFFTRQCYGWTTKCQRCQTSAL